MVSDVRENVVLSAVGDERGIHEEKRRYAF